MAIAPERVADLIRSLAESRHTLGLLHGEVEEMASPLAQLYALELDQNLTKVEEVFDSIRALAPRLTELQNGEG